MLAPTSTKAVPGLSASKTLQLLDSCAIYARSAISSIEGGNPVAAKLLMREFLEKVTETRKCFSGKTRLTPGCAACKSTR